MNISVRRGAKRIAWCTAGLLGLAVAMDFVHNAVRQQRLARALVSAVDRNDPQAVHRLLRLGANPNTPCPWGGNEDWLEREWHALTQGRLARFPDTASALERAIWWSHESGKPVRNYDNADTVYELVAGGGNVNLCIDDHGRKTPLLTVAAELGKWKTVKVLLDYNADVHGKGSNVDSLTWTVVERKGDAKLVEEFLKRGANVNVKVEGDSLLLCALEYKWWEPGNTVENVRATVKCLLRHGASGCDTGENGLTVWSEARWWNDEQLTTMLKRAGARR